MRRFNERQRRERQAREEREWLRKEKSRSKASAENSQTLPMVRKIETMPNPAREPALPYVEDFSPHIAAIVICIVLAFVYFFVLK